MKCPFCGSLESQVLESRAVEDGSGIRRRRECESCKKRFTTYERIKKSFLWVIKKNGDKELFEKEKIRRGVLRSVEKRPVDQKQIDDIVDSVERDLLKKGIEEVPTKMIGQLVLKKLAKTDKVAWLRFASVYMEFEDLKDFSKAIKK